jgi:hypothetical protein
MAKGAQKESFDERIKGPKIVRIKEQPSFANLRCCILELTNRYIGERQ